MAQDLPLNPTFYSRDFLIFVNFKFLTVLFSLVTTNLVIGYSGLFVRSILIVVMILDDVLNEEFLRRLEHFLTLLVNWVHRLDHGGV